MYTDGRRSAAKRLPLTFSLVQKTGAGQFILFYIPLRMFSTKTITRWQLRSGAAPLETQTVNSTEANAGAELQAQPQAQAHKVDAP